MGTPAFAIPALERVAGAHDLVAVYTQPDKPVGRGLEVRPTPVKQRALELGVPAERILQPLKLTLPGEYEKLADLRPDAIVVVAYGQILRRNVLDLPRLGCTNIHSSLLPRWRGAAPIHHAMLAGDARTGVCTMAMAEKLDAGDVYLRAETEIGARETISELHDRLAALGGDLILPTLAGLAAGTLRGEPQDESKATYASKLTKEMEALDPARKAAELDRQVRALNPWPGTSVWMEIPASDGSASQKLERLKIREALAHPGIKLAPGKLHEHTGALYLGAEEGSLQVLRVQPDGKKEMDAAAFLNGLRGRGLKLPLRLVPQTTEDKK